MNDRFETGIRYQCRWGKVSTAKLEAAALARLREKCPGVEPAGSWTVVQDLLDLEVFWVSCEKTYPDPANQ